MLFPASAAGGKAFVEKSTGKPVEVSFEKMSKSKFNGVDPNQFVGEWGISLARLFVLFQAAPEQEIEWDVKSEEFDLKKLPDDIFRRPNPHGF